MSVKIKGKTGKEPKNTVSTRKSANYVYSQKKQKKMN